MAALLPVVQTEVQTESLRDLLSTLMARIERVEGLMTARVHPTAHGDDPFAEARLEDAIAVAAWLNDDEEN